MSKPNVYWVTGLAGAGKTTIGKMLYEHLKKENPATVFFDGDLLREAFDHDLSYSIEDRLKCAMRFSRLCHMMAMQEISVVCCTISMFESVRAWNRKNISRYQEIYIKVPIEILRERNQKGLYCDTESHSNVIGLDLKMEEPQNPDVIILNDGRLSVEECVNDILRKTGFYES